MDYLKQCWKSRTMRFALLLAIFGTVQANLDSLKDMIPAHYYGYVVTAIGVMVAILRVLTTQPLGDK